MTTVDGFQVSPELVKILKPWCHQIEHDETILLGYIDYISRIQDFLSRHTDELDHKLIPEISEYLSLLVSMKDDLKKLEKILPIVPYED
jgi:hypothetical protein